jgi:uncharacterized protein (TIGR04255 family)
MLNEIKYAKPPIVEVVCEFRFVPGAPWDSAIPGLVYAHLRGDFPKRRMFRSLESQVSPSEGGIQQQIHLAERVQFLREDEKAFVQVGPDFLAINHLAPYPSWEGVRPLIQQAFNAYREVAKPTGLRRIGLRYINRIEFPTKPVHFSEFLNFYPHTGAVLPGGIADFVFGVVSPFEQERDALRLQLNCAEMSGVDLLAALLDLDYFLARSQAITMDEALGWVDVAHDHVLTTFEACLTERSRAMFEPEKN